MSSDSEASNVHPLKILLLTQRLPYAPNRGDRIRAYYLLREMSRFAAVSLFSLIHDDEEAAQVGKVPFVEDVTAVRVTRVRNLLKATMQLASRRPLTHCLLDAVDAKAKLQQLAGRGSPDVVVAYCSGMARFALEPPLESLPFVLDMVDVDSAKWAQLARASRAPRRWIYAREAVTLRAFEAEAARRAAATLVVNERERDALLAAAPSVQVTVLSNGIDLEAFAPPGPPATAPVVIFCGVMDYNPNETGVLWFADTVWPRVRAARPDARFVVVGARPTSAIRQLATRDPSIEVTGSVPAVQPYLWRSAVSVAPLSLARGLQNKALEALAAGLPVVATPAVLDGLPPDVRRACEQSESAAEFTDAVLRLLAMAPDERRRRSRMASLSEMTWAQRLRPLEGILRDAVSFGAVRAPGGPARRR